MTKLTRSTRPPLALLALALLGLALSVGALFLAPTKPVAAIAPCVPHTPSGEELSLLASLQSWRDANISGSQPLTQSAPLNAAAKGYAQVLADRGAAGHFVDGANWVSRGVNCGYSANMAAGGEGVAIAASASQALSTMTSEPGGGVFVPSTSGYPIKCVGVARATGASNGKTAWVVMLFGTFGGPCPGAVTGGPPPSATTASPSPSPTPTNTPTPTRTPTPSPTPRGDGAVLTIYEGWNLVTLPNGPVAEVLHRATGCYRAIYQQQGGAWKRFSPEVPAYANNLHMLNGGAFWVEGTAANCGVVPL